MAEPLSPMTCPACGGESRGVLDSRLSSGRVRRRCFCNACSTRWTTYEITADLLQQLEDANRPITVATIQTTKLIKLLDFFRERLVASLPDAS